MKKTISKTEERIEEILNEEKMRMQIRKDLEEEVVEGRSKIVAGVLGILLGMFGVQHFYLGQIGSGIMSILFCWTGIPCLIGFIQGIMYLCMSDKEFNRKFNK